MRKIMVVFGTRPEAIKMCPLVKELKREKEFHTVVCVTGQHKEMLQQVLKIFGICPDYNLEIMENNQTLFDITEKILSKMHILLQQECPDLVLVHGDTTTAFATALSAYYQQIPLGHIEAGLRTYNIKEPYPEEFNRRAVGILADYSFAPTQLAKENLVKEGKNSNTIFITGNTVIDALKTTVSVDYNHEILEWAKGARLILMTVHRRENLGNSLYCIFRGIKRVLDEVDDIAIIYPIHKNPEVRRAAFQVFKQHERIRLIEPLGVIDFHNIMDRSYLILTDSGGIQEEATALGKPVLVLRNTTERSEGVKNGTLKLIGTDSDDVARNFKELLADRDKYLKMCISSDLYGNGTACTQIVNIIKKHILFN